MTKPEVDNSGAAPSEVAILFAQRLVENVSLSTQTASASLELVDVWRRNAESIFDKFVVGAKKFRGKSRRIDNNDAEAVARAFHEAYERLAPSFGYETRKESAKPWADVPDKNKRLMIAVAEDVMRDVECELADLKSYLRETDAKSLETWEIQRRAGLR